MSNDINLEDRRTKACEFLARKGFAGLTELAQYLAVSDSTARRDLETLEEQGIVKRTHGGAIYLKDSLGVRLGFADRQTTMAAAKAAIAQAALELIPDGQTILLDGGTTCYELAKALTGRRVNVITNSVHIASLLSSDLATEVTLLGGYVYPRTGVSLGDTALEQLGRLHASQLFLSCAGLTEEGAFNANQMMVEVEHAMMRAAEELILLVDQTKFGRRAVVKLCDLAELDVVVSDCAADERLGAALAAANVRTVIAQVQPA